jgi:hypothetical protein
MLRVEKIISDLVLCHERGMRVRQWIAATAHSAMALASTVATAWKGRLNSTS